ncbi:ISAs1 family transposase ISAzs5 [Methylobacterium crusticola]|uniref:ISAs1 family transposase ISAzs5 n=1 Tax=Methylobacterium crusticola TaxID=1697972 RepID=A0ABQ4R126_9HYPH|nr:ISAs1 family transposase [Methylobacterium crusticola]GJD50844.1 ISAs1 family transposase ISAzs5 [Methylobacterium crusticola]
MSLAILESLPPSRLKALLAHFAEIEDPREPWRVAHPLPEVLLLVVCGTICDCEDYDLIAAWGEAHLPVLRRYLPYHHGVPGGRWLTLLMNRIDPGLFAQAFTDWVRATWPERPDFVAIDGKTSRRSHDRATGAPPLHLVSAFATTARLVLGQEAVPDKASETTAIPALIARLSERDGLKGALVSIDAVATNPSIAATITAAGADYLLAVKANQPTLRAEIESLFETGLSDEVETVTEHDKGHGRIEERRVGVVRQVDWLDGPRRFPGETRLPGAACLVRVQARTELKDRCRTETRYYVSSAALTAARAADAVRGHWAIENSLHWVLDVVFADDQSRLRKGHGAHTMAVVRHFALNLVRTAPPRPEPKRSPLKRAPRPGAPPKTISLKLRRKMAAWDPNYLQAVLGINPR